MMTTTCLLKQLQRNGYYYEFDKPSGFGIQRVYTKEGDIDETYTVKSGDMVEIPRGYHPVHCAPVITTTTTFG